MIIVTLSCSKNSFKKNYVLRIFTFSSSFGLKSVFEKAIFLTDLVWTTRYA